MVYHLGSRSSSRSPLKRRRFKASQMLSAFGAALVVSNLIWLWNIIDNQAPSIAAGPLPIEVGSVPSKDWFTAALAEDDSHTRLPRRTPTNRSCESSEIDGILHIAMGDIGGAAGTVFFQLVLGQAIYASRNRLKPWVHLNSVSHVVYDPVVHGVGGISITAMVGRNATLIKRPVRVMKDIQPGPLDSNKLSSSSLYFPGTGVWEHYFEPLSDFAPGDTSCTNKVYSTLPLRLITPGIHKFADWAPRCWRYNNMPDYMSKPHLPLSEWLAVQRKLGHDAVNKFLKPRQYILSSAESVNPGCSDKTPCLGMHIRHSDKAEGRRRIELHEFLPYAEVFLHSGGQYIYLATDSSVVINEIESSWPEAIRSKIRTIGNHVVRSSGSEAVFDIGQHHQTNQEILTEIYALSRCQFLVHGLSAVTESAIWINFDLHSRSANLEDPSAISVPIFGSLVQMTLRGEPESNFPSSIARSNRWWNVSDDEESVSPVTKDDDTFCEGFDGALLINAVGNDQSTGGAFFNSILNQLLYAEQRNLKPVVHLLPAGSEIIFDSDVHAGYTDNGEFLDIIDLDSVENLDSLRQGDGQSKHTKLDGRDIWRTYFMPISDLSTFNHASCNSKPIYRLSTSAIARMRLTREGVVRAWKYDGMWERLWNPRNESLTSWMRPMRKKASDLVRKYYRLKPFIADRALLANPTTDEELPCLAIHLRNADKLGDSRQKIKTPEFLEYIEAFLNGGGERVYIASDSHRALQYINHNFPARVKNSIVTQGVHVVRSFREFPAHMIDEHHRVNSEALVDALAMSKCGFLLHGYSTLSEAAIYLNPQLHEHSVNMEDSGRISATVFKKMVSDVVVTKRKILPHSDTVVLHSKSALGERNMSGARVISRASNNECQSNAIIYLAQKVHSSYGRDSYKKLMKSLDLLRENYLSVKNHASNTDVFIFHTGDFNQTDFLAIEKRLGGQAGPQLHLVDLSDTPFWKRPAANEGDIPEKDWYAYPLFSEGYRRMMHWYAIDVWYYFSQWNSFASCSYRYLFRLDEDSFLHSPIQYDVFEQMESKRYVYGYRMCAYEMQVTRRMWKEWRRRHAKFTPKRNVELEMCGFYNNLFVADIDFFLSSPVQEFLKFIDRQGHIYRRRLGDLMIHSMAVYGFAEEDSIHRFLDFTYEHGTMDEESGCPTWGGIQAGYNDPNATATLDQYYQTNLLDKGCHANASFLVYDDLSPSYSHLTRLQERQMSLYTITAGRVEVPGKGLLSG